MTVELRRKSWIRVRVRQGFEGDEGGGGGESEQPRMFSWTGRGQLGGRNGSGPERGRERNVRLEKHLARSGGNPAGRRVDTEWACRPLRARDSRRLAWQYARVTGPQSASGRALGTVLGSDSGMSAHEQIKITTSVKNSFWTARGKEASSLLS